MKGSFIKSSRLPPIIQQRSQRFFKYPANNRNIIYSFKIEECSEPSAIIDPKSCLPALPRLVEEDKDHLCDVVGQLGVGDPVADAPELLKIHSYVLHVQEEQSPLQLPAACKNQKEVLGDPTFTSIKHFHMNTSEGYVLAAQLF